MVVAAGSSDCLDPVTFAVGPAHQPGRSHPACPVSFWDTAHEVAARYQDADGRLCDMDFLDHLDVHRPEQGPWKLTPVEQHANHNGSVHGGVLSTLLDAAMGQAVREGLEDGRETATASLSVTFLAPGKIGEELVVDTEVLQRGGSLVMLIGYVRRPDGVAVAHGVGTFAVIDKG